MFSVVKVTNSSRVPQSCISNLQKCNSSNGVFLSQFHICFQHTPCWVLLADILCDSFLLNMTESLLNFVALLLSHILCAWGSLYFTIKTESLKVQGTTPYTLLLPLYFLSCIQFENQWWIFNHWWINIIQMTRNISL